MEVISREQFQQLKQRPFFKGKIVSDSMEPLIRVGDFIAVDVGATDLRRFDIIVFYSEGRLVCHYLWNMNRVFKPFLLQTRNIRGGKDQPITLDDYLGKVISHRLSVWYKVRIVLKQILSLR